jgi:hypothetical protein
MLTALTLALTIATPTDSTIKVIPNTETQPTCLTRVMTDDRIIEATELAFRTHQQKGCDINKSELRVYRMSVGDFSRNIVVVAPESK